MADFQVDLGQAVIERYGDTLHEVAGFIAGADELIMPWSRFGRLMPRRPVALTAETLRPWRTSFTTLKQALPLDGLLLALHERWWPKITSR